MKRKVNLVGVNTLTVSLPNKFVEANNIQKGEELEATVQNNKIIYSKDSLKLEEKEVEINIDKFTFFSLSRYLTTIYRSGYKKVTLIHSNQDIIHNQKGKLPLHYSKVNSKSVINWMTNRLPGAEIVSQTSKKTIIEFILEDKTRDLDKIKSRVIFLINETMNELLNTINKNYKEFHKNIYDHHDNIVHFINYYLRELSQSNLNEDIKRIIFSKYIVIDKLIDKIRHLSKRIDEFKSTEKTRKYIELTFNLFSKMLEQKRIEDIETIYQEAQSIKSKRDKDKFTSDEMRVIAELDWFLNCQGIFAEAAIQESLFNKVEYKE